MEIVRVKKKGDVKQAIKENRVCMTHEQFPKSIYMALFNNYEIFTGIVSNRFSKSYVKLKLIFFFM